MIFPNGPWWTLIKVMACYPASPSLHQNQCWLVKPQSNATFWIVRTNTDWSHIYTWMRAPIHLYVLLCTVYPKKYAHGFVVLCFVVVMQSFIMNSHEVFIHIHQGCFAGTGAIIRLPQCQWSKPDGYDKISQCITTTKHSKAKTVCIFLGIYCMFTYTYAVYIYKCALAW